MKYLQVIGCLHPLHLARRQRKLKSGIFSYHLILCPHFGQCDGAVITDSPSGIRHMQTLRKLPIQHPTQNTTANQNQYAGGLVCQISYNL